MAIEAEALLAPEETKASAWRPMKDAPTGVPIVAKHKPNDATPHGWIATILLGHDDEDEPGELDTILHYNGNALYRGFHGCWDGWMTCEEAGSLIHRSALAEDTARAVEGWEPIETAPKDGRPIWAYLYSSGIRLVRWWSSEDFAAKYGDDPNAFEPGFYEIDDDSEGWSPKHWMPASSLPSPPALPLTKEAAHVER